MNRKQLALLLIVVTVVIVYALAGDKEMYNLRTYQALFDRAPATMALGFFVVFVLGTALSLPVCGTLSVIAGAIFGEVVALPLALTACAIGGTLAYFSSRYVLRDLIQRRFADQLATVNRGIEKDGAFYLFSMRMIPVIPFWLLNLLMGVTPMTASRFFAATITGMAPVTVILVHFGSQLGAVEHFSLRAIFTPGLVISLALLATMPFIARFIVASVQRARKRLQR